MIKRIWCFLWGHRILTKVYDPKAMRGLIVPYEWKRLPFCLRCGKTMKENL